eukprot:8839949-Pyramimonas_sp.AAC.1
MASRASGASPSGAVAPATSSASSTASADTLNGLRHWSAAVRDALYVARSAAESPESLSDRQMAYAVGYLNENYDLPDEQRSL